MAGWCYIIYWTKWKSGGETIKLEQKNLKKKNILAVILMIYYWYGHGHGVDIPKKKSRTD